MFVKGLEKVPCEQPDDTLRVRPGETTGGRKKSFNLAVSVDVLQGPQAYMMKFSFLVTWSYFELLEKALEILLTQERFSKLSTM